MKIPIENPAGFGPQAGTATGEQGQFDMSSNTNYLKLTRLKIEKSSCRCWSGDLVKDFNIDYYKNTSILQDNDRLVHIPKVDK